MNIKSIILAVVCVFFADFISYGTVPRSNSKMWLHINEGLTNNYIMSLSQDHHGGLWIGTEEGLNRFDGVTVRSFMKNSGVLSGNEINKVLPDRFSDRVWVATQRSGISVFDYTEGTSMFLRHDKADSLSLPSDEVTDIEQDDQGRIWFTTYTKGAGCYDVVTGQITLYNPDNVEGLLNRSFRGLELGTDGRVFLASYGTGIAVLDPESRTAVHYRHEPDNPASLPSNEISCLYKDKKNNIWVGTRKGLALFRNVTMDFHVFDKKNSGLPEGFIMSVLLTKDNRLLVSPDYNGVWGMDISEGVGKDSFERVEGMEELDRFSVRSMFEDDFGNLWIGSYGRGLMFYSYNKDKFTNISDLTENSITGLAFMNDGRLVAGTDGGGVNILDKDFVSVAESDRSVVDGSVLSVKEDSCGDIWIGTFYGSTLVTDNQFRPKKILDIPEVRDFQEHGDEMWVVSGYRGLYRIDRKTGTIISRYSAPEYFPENYLRHMIIDDEDRIWLGTLRSGLFVFDKDMNRIAVYNTDNGFPSNTINHIMMDSRKDIWVATGEGLVKFCEGRTEGYEHVDRVSGLRSQNIKAVAEDERGVIWFSTSLSICWIDSGHDNIHEYDYRSGIAEGNYAPAAVAVNDEGLICFGSTDGITVFYPDEIYDDPYFPSMHFSEVNIFDTDNPLENMNSTIILGSRDEITLKHWQNNFTVSFAVDNFAVADNVEYSYKIEGRDDNWYPADSHNEIVFRQLNPGNYKLLIRSRLTNEDWSSRIISLGIKVTPPIYASAVAIGLYVLAVISALLYIIRLYRSWVHRETDLKLEKDTIVRIREVNEERLRFYTNITHELRTPLTLIIGPLEDMCNDSSIPDNVRQKVSLALKNSHTLMALINKLLDFRKAETHNVQMNPIYADLSKTVDDIGTIFSEANTNRNVEIVSEIETGIMTRFDPEMMAVILNNLLSNAMKYTATGYVKIGLRTMKKDANDYVLLTVEDSGTGISKENQEKIFDRYYQVAGQAQGTGIGLALVKRYVKFHGGTISVESTLGKGSTFIVTMPLFISDMDESENAVVYNDGDKDTGHRPQVVVVDDNEEIRSYVKESLVGRYDVFTANNGAEGLKLISKHIPDIIISDIMMPVMDGIQLCANVKKDLRLSHIPVILLTAKNTIEDRSEGYEAGADSYLTKPFTSNMLHARISNLLESRRKIMSQFTEAISQDKAMEVAQSNYAAIDNEYLKQMTDLIEENISSENLDVAWLADKMNMSPSTLYRKLKGLIGISANEYIRKIKMRKAAEMLASGQYNVSETSWNVGISSVIYFRQCFKEEYGVSPSEYRKSHHSK